MRILYIEDNPANISLLQRIARMGGHDVLYYNDGEVALANFTRDNPDLILVDLQLAGVLGGLDVVRKLRSDGVKLPIVAVTAYAMVGDKERCLEAGCDGYLAKPLPVAELVEIVQKYQLGTKAADVKPAPVPVVTTATAPVPESLKPKQEDATVPDRAQVLGETATLVDPSRTTPAESKPDEAKVPAAAKPAETAAVPGVPAAGESPAPKPETAAPKADTGTQSSVPAQSTAAPKPETTPAPKIGTAPLGSVPAAPTPKPETPTEKAASLPADSAAQPPKPGESAPQPPSVTNNGGDTIRFAVAPQKAENGKKD
jgi:two-component system cell cycle response regulator DivK